MPQYMTIKRVQPGRNIVSKQNIGLVFYFNPEHYYQVWRQAQDTVKSSVQDGIDKL